MLATYMPQEFFYRHKSIRSWCKTANQVYGSNAHYLNSPFLQILQSETTLLGEKWKSIGRTMK